MLISLLKNGQIVINENTAHDTCRPTTSLTPYGTHHPTNGLTPYVTHHPTTSLTPNPSPRGEGSSMLLKRILFDAYPQHSASPPFHARGGGVISLVLLQCTLCLQGIPLPSPLGEGLGVRPVVGWRVVCCVVLFLLFFFLFLLPLPLSSKYAEQVKEEVDEVEIER